MKRSVKTHEFNNKIWAFSYTRAWANLWRDRSINSTKIDHALVYKLVYIPGACTNNTL